MAKDNKRIVDIPRPLLEEAFQLQSYRQVALKLGIYYCSGALAQLRSAAQVHGINVSHLEANTKVSVEQIKSKLAGKNKRRREVEKQLRDGSVFDYSRFIYYDSRRYDKDNGYENDLTIEKIQKLLSIGECSYCKNKNIKLTLDRRDNNKGHLIDNVEVACIRCNLIRGNMPWDAWQHIIPAIRSAYDSGLFEGWMPRNMTSG